MPHTIDPSLADEYRRKGYICIPGLLGSQEVDVLNAATERVIGIDGPQVMREKKWPAPCDLRHASS